jgi:hypothetical protein
VLVKDAQTAERGVFTAFPDLLVDGKGVLLLAAVARVNGATCGICHGLPSLRFLAVAVLLSDCATHAFGFASSFSPSSSERYCLTSAGTIARSMNSRSSGVSGDFFTGRMGTSFGAVAIQCVILSARQMNASDES